MHRQHQHVQQVLVIARIGDKPQCLPIPKQGERDPQGVDALGAHQVFVACVGRVDAVIQHLPVQPQAFAAALLQKGVDQLGKDAVFKEVAGGKAQPSEETGAEQLAVGKAGAVAWGHGALGMGEDPHGTALGVHGGVGALDQIRVLLACKADGGLETAGNQGVVRVQKEHILGPAAFQRAVSRGGGPGVFLADHLQPPFPPGVENGGTAIDRAVVDGYDLQGIGARLRKNGVQASLQPGLGVVNGDDDAQRIFGLVEGKGFIPQRRTTFVRADACQIGHGLFSRGQGRFVGTERGEQLHGGVPAAELSERFCGIAHGSSLSAAPLRSRTPLFQLSVP